MNLVSRNTGKISGFTLIELLVVSNYSDSCRTFTAGACKSKTEGATR